MEDRDGRMRSLSLPPFPSPLLSFSPTPPTSRVTARTHLQGSSVLSSLLPTPFPPPPLSPLSPASRSSAHPQLHQPSGVRMLSSWSPPAASTKFHSAEMGRVCRSPLAPAWHPRSFLLIQSRGLSSHSCFAGSEWASSVSFFKDALKYSQDVLCFQRGRVEAPSRGPTGSKD